uniref:Uncharacterized protein n=1 Tax=Anopheles quadriannulatus TaxID=34691 RepID=A0A182XRH7_ANOQN
LGRNRLAKNRATKKHHAAKQKIDCTITSVHTTQRRNDLLCLLRNAQDRKSGVVARPCYVIQPIFLHSRNVGHFYAH